VSAKKTTKKLSKSSQDIKKVKVSGKSVAATKKAKPVSKAKNVVAKKAPKPNKSKIVAKKIVPNKKIVKKIAKPIKKVAIKKPPLKPLKKSETKKAVVAKKAMPKKVVSPKKVDKIVIVKKTEPKKEVFKKIEPTKNKIKENNNTKLAKPIVIEKIALKKVIEKKKIDAKPAAPEITKIVKQPKNIKIEVPKEKEEIPRSVVRVGEGIKRKIIKDLNTLPQDLLDKFHHSYPDGYEKFVTSFMTIKNQLIRVVPMETEEANYLIKVPVKIAKDTDDDDDFEAEESDTIGDDGEIESTTEDGEMNFDIADDAD
jgi:hypothetical protein